MKAELIGRKGNERNTIHARVAFDRETLRLVETPFGVQVEMQDMTAAGDLGGPALPSGVIRVALPPFSQVLSVSVESLSSVLLTQKPVLVAPLQRPQPGPSKKPPKPTDPGETGPEKPDRQAPIKPSSLRPPQQEERFIEPFPAPPFELPRPELYEREAKEPRPLARLLAVEQAGMVPIAVIGVSPVRLTDRGLLEFFAHIDISIHYEPVDERRIPNADRPADDRLEMPFIKPIHSRAQAERLVDLARMQVINPEAVFDFSHLFPVLITHVDYLVITDNRTWDPTGMTATGDAGDLVSVFRRLTDWKNRRGLKTRVVTVSDIVAGVYGNFTTGARDLQEVLRNFIKEAYDSWGVAWVLLGGDLSIIPVRQVPGASEGHMAVAAVDPPEDNKAFWTGSFMKMRVSLGIQPSDNLVRGDNGSLIPYDSTGAGGMGWYFTTNNTYATRTTMPTQFVRVNGTAAQINTVLQWLYSANMIPTDLYYADIAGANYSRPGLHDWDLNGNGIYGQHTSDWDIDAVTYVADISVGRAPVSSVAQAEAFVNKVIAYEQFRRPDGARLDTGYPSRMLFVSSNWGGRMWVWSTTSNPPGDNQYFHAAGSDHTQIKLADTPSDLNWRCITQITAADVRVIPYDRSASAARRGWRFTRSGADLSPSEFNFTIFGATFHFPIPTQWIVIFAPAVELAPQGFIFDRVEQDGSLHDQEQLRTQIAAELPAINTVSRLYEDEVDLTPAQAAATPVQHLTEDRLRTALNAGPHFVSLSGHGSWNGCCWLDTNMAQNLANGFHSFIGYADSCLTNQFDVEDSVSERLLYNPNGGAVGYIGNTRFSWIGVGDNFQRAFFHRLTSTRHLGLLNDARTGMVNESTGFWRLYNKWSIFALNTMGDPEMPVWVGRPLTMDVSYPHVIDKRKPFTVSVEFHILFVTVPLAGATVHIRQGSFVRTVVTNAAGQATFDLNPAALGALEVTVTKVGYMPFIDTARITGPAWVSGDVFFIDHQHGSALQTLIRLSMDPGIDGDRNRGWYASKLLADYTVILDAATDAYISGKRISFFVDNTDEGGRIERFRFGSLFLRPLFEIGIDRISLTGEMGESMGTALLPPLAAEVEMAAGMNGGMNGGAATNGDHPMPEEIKEAAPQPGD